MIDETIGRIERTVNEAKTLEPERRQELLAMLGALKQELNHAADARQESAGSVARFAEVTAGEAVREEKDEDLLQTATQGLQRSLRDFEADHPQLVKLVNDLCMTLSNTGI